MSSEISAPEAHIAVIGGGITGARITRELLTPSASGAPAVASVTVVTRRADRIVALEETFGSAAQVLGAEHREPVLDARVGTVVVARAAGDQLPAVMEHLRAGRHVVATSDDPVEVEAMLALGPEAEALGVSLVIGAAMAPGLSCLLVSHAAELLDHVDEVHVARHGAAGPGCARQRLKGAAGRSDRLARR